MFASDPDATSIQEEEACPDRATHDTGFTAGDALELLWLEIVGSPCVARADHLDSAPCIGRNVYASSVTSVHAGRACAGRETTRNHRGQRPVAKHTRRATPGTSTLRHRRLRPLLMRETPPRRRRGVLAP